MNSDANLLVANGGHIDLIKHWAKYLLSRMQSRSQLICSGQAKKLDYRFQLTDVP